MGGEAGDRERDGHHQEAPPDHREVGDPSLVEPGGDLGAQHDADHEGGEDKSQGDAGVVLEKDRGPEEDKDVHGGLGRGLNQSQLEDTCRVEDGL